MSTIAYLSGGKLHLVPAGGEVRTLESKFGQEVRDRAARIHRRHSWKSQGRGARFMSGGLLWGPEQSDPAALPIAIKGLTAGRSPGELLYALQTGEVGGVFAVDTRSGEERRLFHGTDQRVEHLSVREGSGEIVCAVQRDNGTAGLCVMRADGSDLCEVTEGDSIDLAPTWVPGATRQILFQSAGIGRDAQGFPIGLGPFSIQRLALERGELEELAADPGSDLLGPRIDGDGALCFIRRPYKPPRVRGSVWRALLDFLLFPLRLIFAVLQWFNFFTARYTGRPLTTAGGPKKQGADMKQMMIWGNLIDAARAAREGEKRGEEAPDLVPSSWQLVRGRGAQAVTEGEVLAKGVLSFELCADGSIVYTNGSAIFRREASGAVRRLHRAGQIEQVAVIPE